MCFANFAGCRLGDAVRFLPHATSSSRRFTLTSSVPPGLRVKRMQGTDDVWELTFAPDGRATFRYGPEVRPGEPHIVGYASAPTLFSTSPPDSRADHVAV